MEEIRCSVCGSVVNAGDSFCQNCGSPVETPAAPEAVAAPEAPEAPAAPAVPETPVAPAQQETTVLSGNPFSADVPTPEMSGTYQQAPIPEMSGTYQQAPIPDMNTNYQGTYNATYTQTTAVLEKKPGKALGIAALILGILALITSCCFGGLLFGLVGLILSIVCLVKKGSKGLGIAGLITSALGFIISIVMLITVLVAPAAVVSKVEEITGEDISSDFGLDDYDYDDYDDTDDYYNYSSLTGTNQIMVDGIVYTMPVSLSEANLQVSSLYSDVVSDVETNGMYPGDYEFVILETTDGYSSFWGYIENTGSDTIYSVDQLQLTGINVDNYSSDCSASSAEVYGGVYLYMSREDVEAAIGTCDYEDDGLECYESESGNEILRIEYDDYGYVCAIDVTIY